MATKLNSPVTREVAVTVKDRGRDRPLVVTLDRTTITFRLKNTRQSVTVALDKVAKESFDRAARAGAGL